MFTVSVYVCVHVFEHVCVGAVGSKVIVCVGRVASTNSFYILCQPQPQVLCAFGASTQYLGTCSEDQLPQSTRCIKQRTCANRLPRGSISVFSGMRLNRNK